MKRILRLLLAIPLVASAERELIWPDGKMPDAQPHQIAARAAFQVAAPLCFSKLLCISCRAAEMQIPQPSKHLNPNPEGTKQ